MCNLHKQGQCVRVSKMDGTAVSYFNSAKSSIIQKFQFKIDVNKNETQEYV